MTSDTVVLGLGSNLGDRVTNIETAIEHLANDARWVLLRRAQVYESTAMGEGAGDRFLNTAVAGLFAGSPEELLQRCLDVEQLLGRVRSYRNAPRIIDIDILWWEGVTVDTPELVIPHARLRERAFALVPLLELVPRCTLTPGGTPLASSLSPELLLQGIETFSQPAASPAVAHV